MLELTIENCYESHLSGYWPERLKLWRWPRSLNSHTDGWCYCKVITEEFANHFGNMMSIKISFQKSRHKNKSWVEFVVSNEKSSCHGSTHRNFMAPHLEVDQPPTVSSCLYVNSCLYGGDICITPEALDLFVSVQIWPLSFHTIISYPRLSLLVPPKSPYLHTHWQRSG